MRRSYTLSFLTFGLLVGCNPTPPIQGDALSGTLSPSAGRVTLTVEGKPPTTTDAQGNFRIGGVQMPYTLKATFPDPSFEGRNIAVILENVTTPDVAPLLNAWIESSRRFVSSTSSPVSSAQIKGSIGRVDWYQDINLYLTTPRYSSARGVRVQPTSLGPVGAYTLELKDFVYGYDLLPTGRGTLHAFQSNGDYMNLMQTYTAYGKRRLDNIPESGVIENQNLELKRISTATVTVKPSAPVGSSDSSFYLSTHYQGDPTEGTLALGRGSFEGEGKVALPVTGEGSYYISVGGSTGATFSRFQTLPARLEVTLPNPVNPISPAREAKVSASQTQTLTWSGDPGAFSVSLAKSMGSGPPQLLFMGMVPQNSLDLKRHGFVLEPNSSYYINISRMGKLPYADALALMSGALVANSLMGNFSQLEYNHYHGPFSTLP